MKKSRVKKSSVKHKLIYLYIAQCDLPKNLLVDKEFKIDTANNFDLVVIVIYIIGTLKS
jgi:hypothetical protein